MLYVDIFKEVYNEDINNSELITNFEIFNNIKKTPVQLVLRGIQCASHTLQLSVLVILQHRQISQYIYNAHILVKKKKERRKHIFQSSLTNMLTKPPKIDCIRLYYSLGFSI